MFAWIGRRHLHLLASIYIYNEHRGYTAVDRVLEAVRVRSPDDVERHCQTNVAAGWWRC